jgi:DtxR family Mn-dependent transcriptional regulator
MVRTHRLLERYLHDAEGLPIADLHQAADRLEHHVDPAALEDMDRALGRPTVDPHGHPIPRETTTLSAIAGCPLTACQPGHSGRVAMVGDDREDLLAAMVRAGIVPRAEVTLLEHGDDHVVGVVAGRRVRLPVELAERVFVVDVQPASAQSVSAEQIQP